MMTDTEKAISLLQQCLDEWPCAAVRVYQIMSWIQEAVNLLKEQEPQSVVESSNMYTGLSITHCPKCGFALDRFLYGREYQGEIKHCPMCGKAVKWE